MRTARYKEIEDGGTLTEEEVKEGWHFCPDWDYMLINSNDAYGESCTCEKKKGGE